MQGQVASLPTSRLADLTADTDVSGVAQGAVLYRGASKFNALAAGTSGYVLKAQGAGANPTWVDPLSLVPKRSCAIAILSGYTPTATGADACEIPVPYSPADGTTSITWNVRRITFRVSTAGGAPALKVQKSTAGNAAFSATDVDALTMGSGEYQVSTTSSFDSSTVASGDLLRVNVTTLGTATGWTVVVLLEAQ